MLKLFILHIFCKSSYEYLKILMCQSKRDVFFTKKKNVDAQTQKNNLFLSYMQPTTQILR